YHERIVAILEGEAAGAYDRHLDDLCLHTIHARAWTKAIHYLHMSAGMAADRSSYVLAEMYFNRALAISRTIEDNADTLKSRIGILLALRGMVGANHNYLEANRILDEAEQLAHKLGDVEAQSKIMAHRAHVLNTLGDYEAAVALAERSRDFAQKHRDTDLLLLANYF